MAKKIVIKPRLPVGVVQKLSGNSGGGTHHKKKGKGSYVRKDKHASRSVGSVQYRISLIF